MTGAAHPEAARVAAEVEARWGVPVDPGVVRVVPRGVSGLDLPQWDGEANRLNYGNSTGAALSWRGGTPEARARKRRMAAYPAMNARRAEVARLHGLGFVMSEIVEAAGATWQTVRNDLRILGLEPHRRVALPPPPKLVKPPKDRVARVRIEARLEDVARLFRQGLDDRAIAAALGVALRTVTRARKAAGLRRAPEDALMAYRVQRMTAIAARRAEVARRLGEGQAVADVAAALGVTLAVVTVDARRAGVSPRAGRQAAAVERRAEVVRMLAEGRVRAEILAALGCAAHVLRDDCKVLGLRLPDRRQACRTRAVRRAQDVADLRAEGLGRADIAARLGVALGTVDRVIRQAPALGVAMPKPVPAPDVRNRASCIIAARRAEVARRTQAGESGAAIAAALGCGRSTVDSDRRALGLGPGQNWRQGRQERGFGHG